jgi:hypothetical protein
VGCEFICNLVLSQPIVVVPADLNFENGLLLCKYIFRVATKMLALFGLAYHRKSLDDHHAAFKKWLHYNLVGSWQRQKSGCILLEADMISNGSALKRWFLCRFTETRR